MSRLLYRLEFIDRYIYEFLVGIIIYRYPHAGAGMRGGVAGFHGYGLKGDDCGLKGDFFLFSCSIGFA